jgi:WD40 repeat protein
VEGRSLTRRSPEEAVVKPTAHWSVLLLSLMLGPAAAAEGALPDGACRRFGMTRFRHEDDMTGAAFSADGKRLATTGRRDGLRVWDVDAGKQLCHIAVGRMSHWWPVALSPDGRLVALERENSLCLWEVETGKLIRTIPLHKGVTTWPAFSPDGKFLAAPEGVGAGVWRVDDGKALPWADVLRGVGIVAFSADGKTLAVSRDEIRDRDGKEGAGDAEPYGGVELRDVADGKVRLALPTGRIVDLSIARDGKSLVTVDGDAVVRLWDLGTGKLRWERRLWDGELARVRTAFAPDGSVLAYGGPFDSPLDLLRAADGAEVRRKGGGRKAKEALFAPDGRTLLTWGDWQHAPRRWDCATGEAIDDADGLIRPAEALAFSPDGKLLAGGSSSYDGEVCVWEAASGRPVHRLDRVHEYRLSALTFSPDGKTLAVTSEWEVCLWDMTTGRRLRLLKWDGWRIRQTLFSADGAQLLTCDDSGGLTPEGGEREARLAVWDPATGKQGRRLTVPAPARLTGDGDALVQFDPAHKQLWAEPLPGARVPVAFRMPFSGDGEVLLSADGKTLVEERRGEEVVLRETATGRARRRFPGSSLRAFSSDGRLVALDRWSEPGVCVLDLVEDRELLTLPESTWGAVAFSPDARFVGGAQADATVLMWDLSQRRAARSAPVSEKELSSLWGELAEADAERADWALRKLVRSPEQAVALLAARLSSADAAWARRIDRLLADLDDDAFAVREKATQALAAMGVEARPALWGLLEGKPPAEAKRRAAALLDDPALDRWPPEALCRLRAVQALELIGGDDARAVLTGLARGEGRSLLTLDALAALRRLDRRRGRP